MLATLARYAVRFFLLLLPGLGCDGEASPKDTGDADADSDTDSGTDTATGDCYPLADGSCVEESFANPPALEPDALGVYNLSLGPAEVLLDGQRHCVRAYNGAYQGPIIEVPASGSARSIRIDLFNTFADHAYRSLEGQTCTCTDSMGMDCDPGGHETGHEDCTCVDDSGESCEHTYDFNLTNLHFHGSHVEPDYANGGGCTTDGTLRCRDCSEEADDGAGDGTCFYGDDVLTHVNPGEGTQHRFDLDEDGTHHDGLYWYHPHIHGTTAIQVGSGASGPIIVRGPIDEVEGIANARERIISFSTPSVGENGFTPLADGVECSEDTLSFDDFTVLSSTSAPQVNVINGLRRPRMVTAPAQVERWRFLHAGFLDEVFLGLFRGTDSDCSGYTVDESATGSFFQVSRDGITLPATYESDYLFMSPGYRIDTMVGGPAFADGDTWCLVAARFLQDNGTSGGPESPPEVPDDDAIATAFENDGDVVMIVNVATSYGTATETTFPTSDAVAAVAPSTTIEGVSASDRCDAAAVIDDPAEIDQLAILQVGFFTADDPDPCECDNYNVNCRNFEETDRSVYPVDRDLPIGSVEHWRLAASLDGHPFHIHTNPVLLCPEDNPFDPLPFAHWRDTYLVNTTRRVDAIAYYRKFAGLHVQHCHKLTHEDHGMMELLRTCDPATDSTCGDYRWDTCADGDLTCVQKLSATECALGVYDEAEAAACSAMLAGPEGVCGPNACASDDDCGPGTSCQDYVCAPG